MGFIGSKIGAASRVFDGLELLARDLGTKSYSALKKVLYEYVSQISLLSIKAR